MTKEEATIRLMNLCTNGAMIPLGYVDNFVSSLIDDFEARVCANCKYYHDGKYPDDRYCDMDISIMEEFSVLEPDFGCNQFKAKEK